MRQIVYPDRPSAIPEPLPAAREIPARDLPAGMWLNSNAKSFD